MKKNTRKKAPTLLQIINAVEDEVSHIIEAKDEKRYFYALMLCSSFIENVLKHLVYNDALWQVSRQEITLSSDESEAIEAKYIGRCSFHQAIRYAASGPLKTSQSLVKRLDLFRENRNSLVHELWLYHASRTSPKVLRRELAGAVYLCTALCRRLSKLSNEVGGGLILGTPPDWSDLPEPAW